MGCFRLFFSHFATNGFQKAAFTSAFLAPKNASKIKKYFGISVLLISSDFQFIQVHPVLQLLDFQTPEFSWAPGILSFSYLSDSGFYYKEHFISK